MANVVEVEIRVNKAILADLAWWKETAEQLAWVLDRVQWTRTIVGVSINGAEYENLCPECEWEETVHGPDCSLDAALSRFDQGPPGEEAP